MVSRPGRRYPPHAPYPRRVIQAYLGASIVAFVRLKRRCRMLLVGYSHDVYCNHCGGRYPVGCPSQELLSSSKKNYGRIG